MTARCCAGCFEPTATALITARNYAAQACPACKPKLRREASRAGPPVMESPINQPQEQPQLF